MEKKSIAILKQMFKDEQITDQMIEILKKDERKGVQQLVKQYEKAVIEANMKRDRFVKMKHFDEGYMTANRKMIAGVDEAGRGPLAGPVVAAAVLLPQHFEVIGLTDSKQLTADERNTFFTEVKKEAIAYAIEVIPASKIDQINILEATKLAMQQSLLNLPTKPEFALIDAVTLEDLPFPHEAVIKGDDRSISIAAASILAKVTRDQIMDEYDETYPQYGFKQHKGYGTKVHMEAMLQYGVTPIHRTTFRPVQDILK